MRGSKVIFLNKQQGVALLEVLIAFVIVTISVMALYQLQNVYLRNEITSSARLTALHIAESKLDDLRTFSSLSSVSSGIPAYDDIDDNTGGLIASGAISSNNANVGDFVYNLSWDVTPQSGSRDITVTVSWFDNNAVVNNGIEQVQLFGSVTPAQRIDRDRLTNIGKTGNEKPIVSYIAGLAPDVISIALDDAGTKQETTKPLPEVANKGGGIQSQFSTITYDADSNTQVQSDFTTVSCSCNFSAAKSALLPASPYLTDTNLLYWQVGSAATKTTGSVADNTQSTLCSICCEHHFDNDASGESGRFVDYYNQLNRSATKFSYNGSSYNEEISGGYIDSCRLLRLDGLYKPMPDWNLVKLNVMSASYLSDTDNVAKYQAYIKDVVTSYVTLMKDSTLWGSSTTNRGVFKIAPNNVDTSGILDFSAWLTSKGHSSTNLTMTVGDTPVQLIARGIFIDFLSDEDANNDQKTDSWIGSIDVDDSDILKKVPFYDINMTLLSRWESASAAVTVANEVIKSLDSTNTDYYGVYRRGYITPITDTASGGIAVTATAYQGNSSVAAYQDSKNSSEIAVSEFERDYARSGSINVTVSSSAATGGQISVIGKIYCYAAKANGDITDCVQGQTNYLNSITINGTSADCVKETYSNEKAYLLYNCKVTPPASGSKVTVATTATDFVVSPSTGLSLMIPEGATSPVNGGCFNVYNNTISGSVPTCSN